MGMSAAELRQIRGSEISLVSQDPMSALDPVFTVGDQIRELLRLDGASRSEASARALRLFEMVGIPGARNRLDSYPHELSGGLRQRVLIAMALSRNPALLIADEPTTALDATVQAQILELLRELQRELTMAVLMISHDLGVVSQVSERLVVMYAGHVVEMGPTRDLLRRPHHPYTKGLIECIPRLSAAPGVRLVPIAGSPPDPLSRPQGCPFWPRCRFHEPGDCTANMPELRSVDAVHAVACFHSERVA
jgi:oligopeptide transport system ATP-binding protein